jgi:hypothetical protein
VTADGKVGIDSGSTARDFPSLEIYRYSMDGNGLHTPEAPACENSRLFALGRRERQVC